MSHTEAIARRPEPPRWIDRVKLAWRSYTLGPLSSSSPELARLLGSMGSVSSGVAVTEESAQTYSAVSAAVSLVSDDIASLPLMLYRRLSTGGKDRFEAHPLYRLLHDAPNPEMTTMVWRRTMQTHVMLWGNAYAEIERDGGGRPVGIWPLIPERVAPVRVGGALAYRYLQPSGGELLFPAADMIHLTGWSHDGSVGASLVQRAKESIGLGLAAERFGGSFFGNGATFGGVIGFKGPKPPTVAEDNWRDQLNARHQGVDRAHRILALYNDATYTRMGVEPNAAQFLETRVFQVREVCRWFKIPPHKLGDLADATYSNVEQMETAYVASALRPWLVLWEQELARKLIARQERQIQFIEHNVEGLLRADAASRGDFYSKLFSLGAVTPNEIRSRENLDPIPGGDTSFVPLNMIPLDRLAEYVDATIAAKSAPASPAAPSEDDPTPADEPVSAETLRTLWAEVERRLDEGQARLEAALAVKAQAEAEREALRTMAEATSSDLAEAQGRVRELTGHAAQVATIRAECDRLEQERARLAGQIQAVRQAHHSLVRDTVDRVLQREIDRSRKAQATPEKLRTWMETFYPLHTDTVRAALRPVLTSWAACTGMAAADLLEREVTAHLEESLGALRQVATAEDGDHLAQQLERVTRRWEIDRAVAVADRICGEASHV